MLSKKKSINFMVVALLLGTTVDAIKVNTKQTSASKQ